MAEPKTLKFQLMLAPSDMARVDEFRWKNRIGSRAAAVRRLIEDGLAREAKGAAEVAASPRLITSTNP